MRTEEETLAAMTGQIAVVTLRYSATVQEGDLLLHAQSSQLGGWNESWESYDQQAHQYCEFESKERLPMPRDVLQDRDSRRLFVLVSD
jgi:hypothetical protein